MANQTLRDHYDALYADRTVEHVRTVPLVAFPNTRFEGSVKAVHERWPKKEGIRVLEVGGGDGIIANSIRTLGLPFDRYVLTDLTRTRVEASRQALGDPRFEVAELDLESEESWPFAEDEQFDVVLVIALIEHLIDPISAMRRLRAHVAPGGFVFVLTPNIARWAKRARLLVGQFPSTASKEEGLRKFNGDPVGLHDEGHLHYFTFNSLTRLLTEYAGYARVEPCPYWEGQRIGPKWLEDRLAHLWPPMFSELAVAVYVDG